MRELGNVVMVQVSERTYLTNIKFVRRKLLHKENKWSIRFVHSGPNRTSGGPTSSGPSSTDFDILKIYKTICSFKCDMKR